MKGNTQAIYNRKQAGKLGYTAEKVDEFVAALIENCSTEARLEATALESADDVEAAEAAGEVAGKAESDPAESPAEAAGGFSVPLKELT